MERIETPGNETVKRPVRNLAKGGLRTTALVSPARKLAAFVLACVPFLALGAVGALSAQGPPQPETGFVAVGRVVDESDGTPLVAALVTLNGAEWGVLTDERGNFPIELADSGTVRFEVSLIGYADLVWEGEIEPGVNVTIELKPQPILLEGLEIVVDRFRSRRKATATTVRAFEREDLAFAHQGTVLELIESRVLTFPTPCPGSFMNSTCLRIRGRAVEPTVYLDEMPLPGGLDYLSVVAPQELEMLEIFGRGRHIRAYTARYMERAAKIRLFPIPIF